MNSKRRYIDYWTAIMCDTSINSYLFTIRNNKGFRNALSWLVLRAEKLNTGESIIKLYISSQIIFLINVA